jgi:hypothetical protein
MIMNQMRKIYHSRFSSFFKYNLRHAAWPKHPSEHRFDEINQILMILFVHRVRTHIRLIDVKLTNNLISTFVSLISRDMKKLYVSNIVDYETALASKIVREEFFD